MRFPRINALDAEAESVVSNERSREYDDHGERDRGVLQITCTKLVSLNVSTLYKDCGILKNRHIIHERKFFKRRTICRDA